MISTFDDPIVDQMEGVLKVIATHGYENDGIGAEVAIGVGVLVSSQRKKLMRMANIGSQRRYMESIKDKLNQMIR